MTTKFDLQTMVEFSVAVELLGARSINALIHQMVHEKIREAKSLTSAEQFEKMVESQKKETLSRSEKKSNERLARLGVVLKGSS